MATTATSPLLAGPPRSSRPAVAALVLLLVCAFASTSDRVSDIYRSGHVVSEKHLPAAAAAAAVASTSVPVASPAPTTYAPAAFAAPAAPVAPLAPTAFAPAPATADDIAGSDDPITEQQLLLADATFRYNSPAALDKPALQQEVAAATDALAAMQAAVEEEAGAGAAERASEKKGAAEDSVVAGRTEAMQAKQEVSCAPPHPRRTASMGRATPSRSLIAPWLLGVQDRRAW